MANEKSVTSMKKVVFEYQLSSTSVQMIWNAIATAPGLASWFANDVSCNDRIFEFVWGKHERRIAEMINCRQNTYVRFRWQDGDPNAFFEFRIQRNDLTGTFNLEITDFVEEGEEEDEKSLWDTSIDALRRCGL